MALKMGDILNNRYRILAILGQGGFGAVYRAADMRLKRPCAVKENLDPIPTRELRIIGFHPAANTSFWYAVSTMTKQVPTHCH